MTHNNWQTYGPWATGPQNQEVELPLHLQGPFLREFVPPRSYKHHGAQIASVVFYRNGGYSIITIRGRQNVNKPIFRRPGSVCHIACGRHQVSFEMELPTLGDQANFLCSVDVNWEVKDFHAAAVKRVVDVEQMLRPPLLGRLRMITRRLRLDGAQAADEAIQSELANGHWADFGAEIGLTTEVFVRIDLGRAAADQNRTMTQVAYNATVQSAIDRASQARIQANLPAARQLIEAGEAQQYAHLLAADPDRAADILGALQMQAKEQRQGALEYLSRLIDQGVVQRHQVEDQVQMLIDYARSLSGAVFTDGLPRAATVLPVPPAPPAPPEAAQEWMVQPTESVPPATPAAPGADIPPMPPVPPYVPPSADLPPLALHPLDTANDATAIDGTFGTANHSEATPDTEEGTADGHGL